MRTTKNNGRTRWWGERPIVWRRWRGFTLIELLVVIGIIAVLIAIIVPSVSAMRKQAQISAITQTLSSITTGIQSYYNDMGQYPASSGVSAATGGLALAQALTIPIQKGPGGKGRVYGPYISLKMQGQISGMLSYGYLVDGNKSAGSQYPGGYPILYYRSVMMAPLASGSNPPQPSMVFDASSGFFNPNDNSTFYSSFSPTPNPTGAPVDFFRRLGSKSGSNTIVAGDNIPQGQSYLLVSPGPDGVYFTKDDVVNVP